MFQFPTFGPQLIGKQYSKAQLAAVVTHAIKMLGALNQRL